MGAFSLVDLRLAQGFFKKKAGFSKIVAELSWKLTAALYLILQNSLTPAQTPSGLRVFGVRRKLTNANAKQIRNPSKPTQDYELTNASAITLTPTHAGPTNS